MAEGSGDDALEFLDIDLAHHRMGLTTASLSIRKYRPIIPQQHILHKPIGRLGINQLLCRSLAKHMVESK